MAIVIGQAVADRVTAVVERTVYHNKENGFTVLSVKRGDDYFSITGRLHAALDQGQEIEAEGEWVTDRRYGRQLKATKIETKDPTTQAGIIAYLASGIISGIGPSMAERIAASFGAETLSIFDDDPQRLLTIKGIGGKTFERIMASWREKREGAKITSKICDMGLSITYAVRIYKKYGKDALDVIRGNPYQLSEDIPGIGFKKADEIASTIGFDKTHPARLRAGVLFALREAQHQGGHCYLPKDELKKHAMGMLGVNGQFIEDTIQTLDAGQSLKVVMDTDFMEICYLPYVYNAERYVGGKLREMAAAPDRKLAHPLDNKVDDNILTPEQFAAAEIALKKRLSVLTGAAGTGKTTTLRAIINCLERNGLSFRLCSPTGKASKRMHEVTGHPASTIHRLLGYDPFGNFIHDENNPILADYIIVDEATMTDLVLMNHFLKALQDGASLILIGDVHQLPAVGLGMPFASLIKSGICPVTELKKIQRQKEGSSVVRVANEIKNGIAPKLEEYKEGREVFFFEKSEKDTPEAIIEKVVEIALKKIPRKFGIAFEEIQILAPMNKGAVGNIKLNATIQKAIHPDGTPSLKGLFLNDRIIQTINNYEKGESGIFNGEIGFIKEVHLDERYIIVDFDGQIIRYEYAELEQLMPAYSLSVHKFQGSEARAVIVVISKKHHLPMMARDLVYTAVTRTRELLIVVGSKEAIALGVNTDKKTHRYTKLLS